MCSVQDYIHRFKRHLNKSSDIHRHRCSPQLSAKDLYFISDFIPEHGRKPSRKKNLNQFQIQMHDGRTEIIVEIIVDTPEELVTSFITDS